MYLAYGPLLPHFFFQLWSSLWSSAACVWQKTQGIRSLDIVCEFTFWNACILDTAGHVTCSSYMIARFFGWLRMGLFALLGIFVHEWMVDLVCCVFQHVGQPTFGATNAEVRNIVIGCIISAALGYTRFDPDRRCLAYTSITDL